MEMLNEKEMSRMTDQELELASVRIEKDVDMGIFNDKRNPLDNLQTLSEELEKRGCAPKRLPVRRAV